MREYWKLKDLAEVLMDELIQQIGLERVGSLMRASGYDGPVLEGLGFSESALYGLGFTDDKEATQ